MSAPEPNQPFRRPLPPPRAEGSLSPPEPPEPEAATAPDEPASENESAAGPVAWKAAASSVPKLREQPAAPPALADEFPGFAQDAVAASGPARLGEGPARLEEPDALPTGASPLSVEPPFWELWLDRLRMVPPPVLLGVCVVLAVAVVAVFALEPGQERSVSLARVRQQPEAYDGRVIHVRGRAGEAFEVGGSYVFNLSQGRDTIVVYSRTRRPRLHERVRATGTVSVGYLDGTPRVALLEEPPAP